MNPWIMAWRQLMRRKLRTWLTIMSIAIGVASTFAVISAVDSAKQAFPIYLKAAFGKADFNVLGTDEYISDDLLAVLEQAEHMTAIALMKETAKLVVQDESISSIQRRVGLTGYSRLDSPVTGFQLIEGDLAANGAVITDKTAKLWGKSVGDTVTFETERGTHTIRISAIVQYSVELMGPGSWMMAKYHPWSAAVPLEDLQRWYELDGKINGIQVRADPGADLEAVQQQLDLIADEHEGIYTQQVVLDFDLQNQTVNSFFFALYIAGLLGIALSAFVIFNSLYVGIKERKKEFAALKTIGYMPEQLRTMVLFEVMVLALVGTLLGLLIGYGLGLALKAIIFLVFGVHASTGMELAAGLAVSILAGVLVPILAALYPIRQVGKVSVIEVLKETSAAASSYGVWRPVVGVALLAGSFFIKHLLLIVPLMIGIVLVYPYLFRVFSFAVKPLYKLLFGFTGDTAARNLTRNIGRTSMTSVILCLGIAMIVLMSSLNSALLQSYEKIIYSSYGGNLDIMLHHVEDTDVETLLGTEGVADAVTYPHNSAVWQHEGKQRKLPVYGVEEEWIDRFPLFVSERTAHSEIISLLADDQIVLDRIAYGLWGGEIGGRIELETLQGVRSFEVVAVVDTMKNSGFGSFMKKEHFIDYFGDSHEHNALVIKDEHTSPLQLRENVFDQFGDRIEAMFGPEDWVTVIGATYTGSFAIINALVILSIFISGIGITNTLLMNILERVREIGMMRAVGITRRQVIRMIMLEGFAIGLAATVLGIVIGLVLIYMTSGFLEVNFLTYEFNISGFVVGVTCAFGIVISLLSSFMPASRASRTKLSEALRYE